MGRFSTSKRITTLAHCYDKRHVLYYRCLRDTRTSSPRRPLIYNRSIYYHSVHREPICVALPAREYTVHASNSGTRLCRTQSTEYSTSRRRHELLSANNSPPAHPRQAKDACASKIRSFAFHSVPQSDPCLLALFTYLFICS